MAANGTSDKDRLIAQENARKQVELAAKEKASAYKIVPNRPRPDVGVPNAGNMVMLTMANPMLIKETAQLQKQLERTDGLKIVATGGVARGGTFICLSMERPVDLSSLLNRMPMVGGVSGKGRNLVVALKSNDIG